MFRIMIKMKGGEDCYIEGDYCFVMIVVKYKGSVK
jgi:hypothetical protein